MSDNTLFNAGMEELLTCAVCCERYTEKGRPPVLLPRCGHSFCRPCVALLVMGGCINCPNCRTDQRIESAEKLPTEYSLLAIINAQETQKSETCIRHSVKLSFWCTTCSVATCGECLFEDHPTHSHDVMRAVKYIDMMKETATDIAKRFVDVLDDREKELYRGVFLAARQVSDGLRTVNVLRKDMDEARRLMKGIKEVEGIGATTTLSEAAKFLGLKWNIRVANFGEDKNQEVKKEKKKRKNKSDKISGVKELDIVNKETYCDNSEQSENIKGYVLNDNCIDERIINGIIDIHDEMKLNPLSKTKSNSKIEKDNSNDVKNSFNSSSKTNVIDPKDPKWDESRNPAKWVRRSKTMSMISAVNENLEIPKPVIEDEPKHRGRLARLALKKAQLDTPQSMTNGSISPTGEHNTDTKQNTDHIVEENRAALDIGDTGAEDQVITPIPEEETIKEEEIEKPMAEYEPDEKNRLAEDLQQVPELTLVVEGKGGRLARTEWESKGLHVYCHQGVMVPYDVVFRSSLLRTLVPSKSPLVFLDLTADEVPIGRVYIRLWGHLRRAQNFLTLCIGDTGPSYRSTRFLDVYNCDEAGERIQGGDWELNNGMAGAAVIEEDLEYSGDYSGPMEAGILTAGGNGKRENDSQFLICTEDDVKRNFSCPFGRVEDGIKVVQQAIWTTIPSLIAVEDCGVVLELQK